MASIESGKKGMLYKLDIYNPTAGDIMMRMFDAYGGQSQTSEFYEYQTIYYPNYLAGDAIRVTLPDTTYQEVLISATTPRADVIPLLNALGYGTWSIDSDSLLFNIFRVRPATGITIASFAVKIYQPLFSDSFAANTGWTLNGMAIASNELAMIPIQEVNLGYEYNFFAVTDARGILSSGYIVPSKTDYDDLITYLGVTAGGKLKEAGLAYWLTPNFGATNSSKFNARGSGYRDVTGVFGARTIDFLAYTSTAYDASNGYYISINYNADTASVGANSNTQGLSVRGRALTTSLSEGEQGVYTGNDGKLYRTICLNGIEWIADNLCETKYANGDLIAVETNNAAWAALSTEARCVYDNIEANGMGVGFLYVGNASRADVSFTATSTYRVQFDILTNNIDTFNITLGGDVIDLTAQPIGAYNQDITIATAGSLLKFSAANADAAITNLNIQSKQYLTYISPVYTSGYRSDGLIVKGLIDLNYLTSSGNFENFVIKSLFVYSSNEEQVTQPFNITWADPNGNTNTRVISPVKDLYQRTNAVADIILSNNGKREKGETPYFKINASNFLTWNIQAGSKIVLLCYLDSNSFKSDAFRKLSLLPTVKDDVIKHFGISLFGDNSGIGSKLDQMIYLEQVNLIKSHIAEVGETNIPTDVLQWRQDARNGIVTIINTANSITWAIGQRKPLSYYEAHWLWSVFRVYNRPPYGAYASQSIEALKRGEVIEGRGAGIISEFLLSRINYWKEILPKTAVIQNKTQYTNSIKDIELIAKGLSETNEIGEGVVVADSGNIIKKITNKNTASVTPKKTRTQVVDTEPQEAVSVAVPVSVITQNPDKEVPLLIEGLLLSGKTKEQVFTEVNNGLNKYISTEKIQQYVNLSYTALIESGKITEPIATLKSTEPTNSQQPPFNSRAATLDTNSSGTTKANAKAVTKPNTSNSYERWILRGALISSISVALLVLYKGSEK